MKVRRQLQGHLAIATAKNVPVEHGCKDGGQAKCLNKTNLLLIFIMLTIIIIIIVIVITIVIALFIINVNDTIVH